MQYIEDEDKGDLIWIELERILKREVDLLVLNHAFPIVAWSAIKGIPIVIKDRGLYIDFILSISREAEDLIEFNLDFCKRREKASCLLT